MGGRDDHSARAHPRSRGEHVFGQVGHNGVSGSSPLTRGALVNLHTIRAGHGLIPAHAGSTIRNLTIAAHPWAHPRSRGEHGSFFDDSINRLGSSPLTRGALAPLDTHGSRYRLIPAHAGSTESTWIANINGRAHPRSRGEHCSCRTIPVLVPGSSPLTRGAPNL